MSAPNSRPSFVSPAETLPQDPSQLLIKLTSMHTDVANAVNIREIALYQQDQEIVTGQQFSVIGSNRQKNLAFRKVYYFGAIAAGATLNIPHNITNLVQCTNIYGTCITDIVDYRPIPYSSTAAVNQQISIRVFPSIPAVNAFIEIINGAGAPNITSGIVVLEYLLT